MQLINGGVCAAQGFTANGIHCGIRKNTTKADLALFRRFGMQSGRDADKFAGFAPVERTENGIYRLTEMTNAFLSGRGVNQLDLGTHIMFICDVTQCVRINDKDTMTYTYYQNNVKPKPQTDGKKGYVCKICGWVYEGEPLPEDIVCPLCKHGAADFEPIA